MSANSKISWTDATWAVTSGCREVSPGCANCYAVSHARRMGANPNPKISTRYQGLTVLKGSRRCWSGEVRELPGQLAVPLQHWNAPRRVFANSLSDLFQEGVSDEFIAAVFGVMSACPQHVFQCLTKRAARMAKWCADFERRTHFEAMAAQNPLGWHRRMSLLRAAADAGVEELLDTDTTAFEWPLPNVWLGVSCEDRKHGLPRVDVLQRVPAAVRFVSAEPLLEDLGALDLRGIDWAIIGCESGAGRRPCSVEWVRSIVRQCDAAHVPAFVKQLAIDGRVSHAPAEWPEDLRRQEWPEVTHG